MLEDLRQTLYSNNIKITNAVISLPTLLDRLSYDEINYQDSCIDYPWGEEKMSRLIESILLRIPLPVFYFDVSSPNKWLSINGIQRLYALEQFILNQKLVLKKMEVLTSLEGCTYENLTSKYKRIINDTQIITYQVEAQTPPHLREIIFKKIRDMNEH